jgi:hypothetical protein
VRELPLFQLLMKEMPLLRQAVTQPLLQWQALRERPRL